VVTGTRENISRIVDELQVMESVLLEIAAQMECGNLSLSKEAFDEMRMDFLALIITTLDIMKGASYLFNVNGVKEEIDWKNKLRNLPDNI
jgi:hypothetical protein